MTTHLFLFVSCLLAALGTPGAGVPTLTAETSNPLNNMFAVGKPATVTFRAAGWAAGECRDVTMEISDHADALLEKRMVRLAAGPDGRGEATVSLPTARYGFYRVRAKAGGLTLPKRGTRPAGQFTYGVAMAPVDRPDIPQELAFQGIHGEACEESLWLGAHQDFASTFPSNEARKAWWAEHDGTYPANWRKWGTLNISVGPHMLWEQGLLSSKSVAWLKKNGTNWSIFSSPEGMDVYREWVERKVGRYVNFPFTPGGRRVYSLFWEPDLSTPDKATLVEAAKTGYELVKRHDPEGLVSVPTISNCTRLDWHRELFERGLLQYADVFEIHPYTAYPPEPNGFLENIRAIKKMLREYGRPDMPMIGTESGYQTVATLDGERLQLEGQVRVHLILLGEGFWFNMPFYGTDYGGDRDDHPEGDYGITYNLDYPHPRFGAKHISPRPSFCGISAFSMLLDGWKANDCLDFLGETVLGYAYTNRAGRTTVALWDFGGKPSSITLPVGKTSIETADIMGNRTARTTSDGNLTLALSTAPVYVIDPDRAALERGLAAFRKAAEETARAKAAAPLKITAVTAAFSGDDPAANVTVLNNSDTARTITIGTRIVGEPLARQSVTVSLVPRETRRVTVPLHEFRPEPFRTFELEASADDDSGNRAAKKSRMNFLRATYAPDADRNLSEWPGVPRHKVPQDARAEDGNRAGGIADPADLSAEVGFGWNERALLIDAYVTDDSFRQEQTGWWTWNGDAIQFGFARKRLESLSANDYTDMLEQGTTEVDFALTRNGPEAYRTVTFDPYRLPTDMHGKGQIDLAECPVLIDKEELDGGRVALRYRIAFPWRFINKAEGAKAGEVAYFAATFNDRDKGDKAYSALRLFELKKVAPRRFGNVVLVP